MDHGSVSRRRRRAIATGALGVFLTAGLAGCSEGFNVGAHNACGLPIQVSIDEVLAAGSFAWTPLDDGEHSTRGQ